MKSCIICCREVTDKRSSSVNDGSPEIFTRFLRLLERHLKTGRDDKLDSEDDEACDAGNEQQEATRDCFYEVLPLFETLTNAGMLQSCGACSKVVESFCDLYRQLKSVELLLDWRVWTLRNLMSGEEKLPAKKSKFKDIARQQVGIGDRLGQNESTKLIVNFRRELVKKCDQKQRTTFPRLRLDRYHGGPSRFSDPVHDDSSTIKKEMQDHYLDYEDDRDPGEGPDADHFGDSSRDSDDVAVGREKGSPVPDLELLVRKSTDTLKIIRFRCRKCSKVFFHKSSLRRHQLSTSCGNGLAEKSRRRRLKSSASPQEASKGAKHSCHLCSKVLMGRKQLLDHLQRLHSPSSDYNVDKDLPDADVVILGTEEEHAQDVSSLFTKVTPTPSKSAEDTSMPKYVFNPDTSRYKCCHCSKQFKHLKNWELHYHHYTQVRYECNLCKKQFKRLGDFTCHHKTAHRMVRFKCRECNRLFKEKHILREHHRHHHQGMTYPCPKCKKTFTLKANLQTHLRKSITCGSEVPVKHNCPNCDKEYKSPASLRRHVHVNHSDQPKKHLCSQCGQGFAFEFTLRTHLLVHSDVREHLCHLCGKEFKVKSRLQKHHRVVHLKMKNPKKVEVKVNKV